MLAERKFIELMFDDDATPPNHKAHTKAGVVQKRLISGNTSVTIPPPRVRDFATNQGT